MPAAKAALIAAPRSGAGKTTVTLGLIGALRRRGHTVRTAKSGPDYIDPAFHAAASGHPGTNLDSWAMPPALLGGLLHAQATPGSILLVESAMGLFDGVPADPGRSGASADLAARFRLPVLLVLDVSGQSQTAAAVVLGMHRYRPGVRIGGVILNRVGSPRHRSAVEQALKASRFPVLGAIPKNAGLTLPERHLGLIQSSEHPDLASHLDRLADAIETHVDIAAVLAATASLRTSEHPTDALPPPGQRIALARDAAFTFIYPHLLAGWRRQGAEILPFSPLADEPPPSGADCCWLPGGYPELHAFRLAAAHRFHNGLAAFATTRPVHGECGGYMVLGETLQDSSGDTHRMTGLLSHATSIAGTRRMTLGYRTASLLAPSPIGPASAVIRGHEFHYAQLAVPGTDLPLALLSDGYGRSIGPAGGRRGNVTGAFFHAIAHDPD